VEVVDAHEVRNGQRQAHFATVAVVAPGGRLSIARLHSAASAPRGGRGPLATPKTAVAKAVRAAATPSAHGAGTSGVEPPASATRGAEGPTCRATVASRVRSSGKDADEKPRTTGPSGPPSTKWTRTSLEGRSFALSPLMPGQTLTGKRSGRPAVGVPACSCKRPSLFSPTIR